MLSQKNITLQTLKSAYGANSLDGLVGEGSVCKNNKEVFEIEKKVIWHVISSNQSHYNYILKFINPFKTKYF
jgi:hypothetical protein